MLSVELNIMNDSASIFGIFDSYLLFAFLFIMMLQFTRIYMFPPDHSHNFSQPDCYWVDLITIYFNF